MASEERLPGERAAGKPRRSKKKKFRVGRVTVYPKGETWWIYFREDKTTRRIRIGPDLKEAERRAAEVNAQVAGGVRSSFGFDQVRIDELAPRWIEHHELVLRSSMRTVGRYRTAVAHLLRFLDERHRGLTADRLSTRIAEEFVKYLRTTSVSPIGHPRSKKRPLRDKGVLFILQACRTLLNFAIKRRHLPPYATNPFAEIGIERMRIDDAKPTPVMTEEEEAAFLEACDPWDFRVFFALAFTGMRPGELIHLLVEDLDFGTRTLHIRNHPELGWHTKTRNERRIYLFDELLAVLRNAAGDRTCGPVFLAPRYSYGKGKPPLAGTDTPALARELRRRIEAEPADDPAATPRAREAKLARGIWRDMGAIKPSAIRRHFMSVAKRIGRPDLTCPKMFRHGMATAMQAADVDPFVRKEIIGHTNLATTGIYTHTADLTLARGMMKAAELRERSLALARRRAGDADVNDRRVRRHA